MYTLDTNAIIYYLDEDAAVVPVLEPILAQDIAIFVSVVTELELLSHPGLTEEDIAEIAQVLTSMVVFPLESRLAQLAGTLRRQYRLKRPDSIVAATALLTRTTLVTRNIRDFQEIAALSLLPIDTTAPGILGCIVLLGTPPVFRALRMPGKTIEIKTPRHDPRSRGMTRETVRKIARYFEHMGSTPPREPQWAVRLTRVPPAAPWRPAGLPWQSPR